MNDVLGFEDLLEPLGIAIGVLLVLVGIATVAGQPWTIKDVGPAAVQVLGALGTAAIGAALIWLSRT